MNKKTCLGRYHSYREDGFSQLRMTSLSGKVPSSFLGRPRTLTGKPNVNPHHKQESD